jgi:tripartite-type tricarboxylate transporter receptor subunit TctC
VGNHCNEAAGLDLRSFDKPAAAVGRRATPRHLRQVQQIIFKGEMMGTKRMPARTLQELIQYAKANPGKLTSGCTAGIGPHITLELFRVRTGTNIVFIPYKGAAPAVSDLLGGQIQIGMTSKAVLLPLIKEGRLRALAVTSEVRWPELPEVPTMHESGFDGIPAYLWLGLLAPARTPKEVIDKLNGAVNEGLKSPEVRASIAKLGMEVRSLTAQEFATALADDARNWKTAVKESGVKMD